MLGKKDSSGVTEMIDRLEAAVAGAKSVSDMTFQNAYLSIAIALMDCMSQLKNAIETDLALVYTPTAHASIPQAFGYLKEIAQQILGNQEQQLTDGKLLLVEQIDMYISDNVSRDISLTDISQHFNYNSVYLSRLYSRVTGSTLKTTIVNHRLKYIEQLMRNEALSINEILELSGFKSRSYFNFFIKHTQGMTPSQYRQSLLESH